jgi:hypothetical protein
MNLENQPSPDDILGRATSALRNTMVLDGPPAYCVSATIAAMNARGISPSRLQSKQKWQRTVRAVCYGSLAAVFMLLAAALGVVALWNHAATPAFGQVVESIRKATSVNLTIYSKAEGQPVCQSHVFLQGDLMRIDLYIDSATNVLIQVLCQLQNLWHGGLPDFYGMRRPDLTIVGDFKKTRLRKSTILKKHSSR